MASTDFSRRLAWAYFWKAPETSASEEKPSFTSSRLAAAVPRIWLAINGFVYVIINTTRVLLPQYQGKVFLYSQPTHFRELAFML